MFYERPDTFSLGVCNGCQLFALLGWVPWPGIADVEQLRFIQNASGRFESRFAAVTIEKSPAVMLEGMEGSTLGIWVAHGEGRAYFPDPAILEKVERESLAPIRFVDDQGQVTETYPFNPNGSPHGIAGLCTPDGRHLVVMPHPERRMVKKLSLRANSLKSWGLRSSYGVKSRSSREATVCRSVEASSVEPSWASEYFARKGGT